jgi:hypothetical protein
MAVIVNHDPTGMANLSLYVIVSNLRWDHHTYVIYYVHIIHDIYIHICISGFIHTYIYIFVYNYTYVHNILQVLQVNTNSNNITPESLARRAQLIISI